MGFHTFVHIIASVALAAALPGGHGSGGHGSDSSTNATLISIDASQTFQEYDGIGFSQAFQRATHIRGTRAISPLNQTLSAKNTSRVLDLLFTEEGANFNILRNGIGASLGNPYDLMLSIIPTDPGSPNAIPTYVWDHDDGSQVWLSKEAKKRNSDLIIYADSWSAPGFMKDNGTENWGGHLCGVTGTDCPTGDWRQAYANMLVQYVKFYAQEGLHVDYLGFLNEPDLTVYYASMLSSGRQAADFLKVLYPTVKAAGISTGIVCCDGGGWEEQREILAGIQESGAEYTLDLITSHGYVSPPTAPFDTQKKVWQTEWAELNDKWNVAWDGTGALSDGLVRSAHKKYHALADMTAQIWAQNIQDAFAVSNVSAFLNWIGSEYTGGNGPILLNYGDSIEFSKRFWAYAQFGRFVKRGARRIAATSNYESLHVSAFKNKDGSIAIQVINVGYSDKEIYVKLNHSEGGNIESYLTNNDHDLTQATIRWLGEGTFGGNVPSRSMISFVIKQ